MIPFSALLGNAISNDGDALFPAIAIAPKAAILATIYSAIPAFVMAYTLYFFSLYSDNKINLLKGSYLLSSSSARLIW